MSLGSHYHDDQLLYAYTGPLWIAGPSHKMTSTGIVSEMYQLLLLLYQMVVFISLHFQILQSACHLYIVLRDQEVVGFPDDMSLTPILFASEFTQYEHLMANAYTSATSANIIQWDCI